MTNTEVEVYGKYTKEQLKALSGQLVGGSQDFLPGLTVNKNAEDKDGNELKPGTFTFKHPKLGNVYSKRKEAIKFRPFLHRYRYEAWNPNADGGKGKAEARTIDIKDFKEEAISDNGLIKCGRGAEATKHLQIKCRHILYGTVSFVGTNAKGEAVEVQNEPVVIKIGGKSWDKVSDLLKDAEKRNILIWDHELDLTIVAREGGFYNTDLKWADLTKVLPFDEANLTKFIEYVEANNKLIAKKFEEKLNAKPTEAEKKDKIVEDSDASGELSKDLQDVEDVE